MLTAVAYPQDAAATAVAALEKGRTRQAYNIVDDEPITTGTSRAIGTNHHQGDAVNAGREPHAAR